MGYILRGCPICKSDLWPNPEPHDTDQYVCVGCARTFGTRVDVVQALLAEYPSAMPVPIDLEATKTCTSCGVTKVLTRFAWVHRLHHDLGKRNVCRGCANQGRTATGWQKQKAAEYQQRAASSAAPARRAG